MVEIKLLNKGDSVLAVTERFLAIKRKNGTVDIYKAGFTDTDEYMVDPNKSASILYGEGIVSKMADDGETLFFTV